MRKREIEGKALKDIVQYGLKAVLDLLIPRQCLVCGRSLDATEEHLCRECLEDLPRTYYWRRKFNPMADRFNALIQDGLEVLLSARPAHGTTSQHYAYATALFF